MPHIFLSTSLVDPWKRNITWLILLYSPPVSRYQILCACWLLAQAGTEVQIISAVTTEKEQSHLRKESYSLCYLCSSSPGPCSLVKKSSVPPDYATQRNNFAFKDKYAMKIPTKSSRLTKNPGVLLLKCSPKGGHVAFCCSEMNYR